MSAQKPGGKSAKPTADANEPKPFLQKLYKMVDDPETDHILSWYTTGDGLFIRENEAFVSQLLPQYFKHSNMSSFVRQLNTYGFSKVPSEPPTQHFSHPNFRRGDIDSLSLIQRKSSHRPHTSAGTSVPMPDDDEGPIPMPGDDVANQDEEAMKRELVAIRSHHANMVNGAAPSHCPRHRPPPVRPLLPPSFPCPLLYFHFLFSGACATTTDACDYLRLTDNTAA